VQRRDTSALRPRLLLFLWLLGVGPASPAPAPAPAPALGPALGPCPDPEPPSGVSDRASPYPLPPPYPSLCPSPLSPRHTPSSPGTPPTPFPPAPSPSASLAHHPPCLSGAQVPTAAAKGSPRGLPEGASLTPAPTQGRKVPRKLPRWVGESRGGVRIPEAQEAPRCTGGTGTAT